ncbi:MAG: prepilin-type N-terminal cleavage/methylation domain-containing protein [Candidatus Omnitrophica bacterium]|nr:prepilin-type N-terminal cleavage/methylation domain-containing protein [Candidatus Omnitrophota bacterium]
MKRGFTLLELVVVIIIIGILATLGFTQYGKVIEKGRIAEARMVLGAIRSAQEAYKQEYGAYNATAGNLQVSFPTACTTTHYFSYSVTDNTLGNATRCTASGKKPDVAGASSYYVTLEYASGNFSGNVTGYY